MSSSRKTRASRKSGGDAPSAATSGYTTGAASTDGVAKKRTTRSNSDRSNTSTTAPTTTTTAATTTTTNNNHSNAHRSLTCASVYGLLPSMWPCSTEDVESFGPLEEALRAHSDLSRESAFSLSKKSLAKLVQSMRDFQDVHLGRKSKLAPTQSWPLVRIPDVIFRDRSPDGPLFTVLLSAFRHKHEWSWRSFDLASAKKAEENGTLFKSIQRGLMEAGQLKHPVIYIDETVGGGAAGPARRRRVDDVHRAVSRMAGTVTTDASLATHVVAHDEDVDAEHLVREEERAEEEGMEAEKLYLKTLAIEKSPPPPPPSMTLTAAPATPATRNNTRKRRRGSGGESEFPSEEALDKDSAANANLPPMAFVHWWYWPSSYDEWMVATDVDGEIAEEDDAGHPVGGPWVVSTRFVRDAARFNEWGSEDDYAIVDYQKKVALYSRPAEVKQAAEPSAIPKASVSRPKKVDKETKNKTKSVTIVEPEVPNLPASEKGSTPERKKRRVTTPSTRGDAALHSSSTTTPSSAPPTTTTTSLATTTTLGKDAGAPGNATPKKPFTLPRITASHVSAGPRDRRSGYGMKPRQIVTGLYGPSGHRLRRTVYDGALSVHPQASALLKRVLNDLWSGIGDLNEADLWKPSTPHYLPAVGWLPRPSQDLSLGTEISMTEVRASLSDDGCKAKNRMIRVIPMPEEEDDGEDLDVLETKRIRGGGGDDDDILEVTTRPAHQVAGDNSRAAATSQSFAPPPPSFPGVARSTPVTSTSSTAASSIPKPKTSSSTPTVRTIGKVLRGPTTLGPAVPPPSSSTKPSVVASSSSSSANGGGAVKFGATAVTAAEVIPLKRAAEPAAAAAAREQQDHPTWYHAHGCSSFERSMLPEWFDGSAPHRTSSTYVKTREEVMALARQEAPRYMTATTVRRSVAGDIGSLLRLHSFLTTWGLINADTLPESKPAPSSLRQFLDVERRPAEEAKWTMATKRRLVLGVVTSAKRRRRQEGGAACPTIDWDSVAMELGSGITAAECQREFLALPLDNGDFSSLLKNDSQSGGESAGSVELPSLGYEATKYQMIHELTSSVQPRVLQAAVDAALSVTNDLAEAQKAAVLSCVARRASDHATAQEETVRELLTQVMDQRMQKLENRVAVLDDLEGILEAERIALELERRDLYTARCRHWFSGDH